jgi:hypothetical protein
MPRRKHRWSGPDCRCTSLGKGRSTGLGPKATTCARFAWQLNSAGRQCPLAMSCADRLDGAVLKSQVRLLVGEFGLAAGALALPALRWEHRLRGQMKIEHDVRYQRIGEGLAAFPALQKPFRHRLKILWFSTKSYDREFSVENLLSHEVSSRRYSV